jgi:hypothetical protein
VTVVTTLVCFLFRTRGCGRVGRPAFPAPSEFQKAGHLGRTRAKTRGENAESCLQKMPLLKIESTNARILCVVPANAGTHNHRYLLERKALSHRAKNAGPRRMGPRFRGDDVERLPVRDPLARNDGLNTRHTSMVRSSIPETSVIESRSRGVLDTPARAGYDG